MKLSELYRIQKTDLERCADVSARAFLLDPALKYQMGGKTPTYLQLLHYFRVILQTGFPYYEFYAVSDRIEGVIGLLPPNASCAPPLEFLVRGGWKLPFTTDFGLLGRLDKYEAHCLDIRKSVDAMDAWYVMMLAVDPMEQGKGHGSTLMRAFLQDMDERQTACYLETHKLVNTEIYRHFGF
ncbi:MAG: GNAT family N-acetyltransferase, partial [Clostridiaceae bacterium]